LGNSKAGKLTFIYKYLNSTASKEKLKSNLRWVWDPENNEVPDEPEAMEDEDADEDVTEVVLIDTKDNTGGLD